MLSTHVLDLVHGHPVANLTVSLMAWQRNEWLLLAEKKTDTNGRINEFFSVKWEVGLYKLRFETAQYFRIKDIPTFFPWIEVTFEISSEQPHYHVPLLLSPFGYSTYRGS